MSIIYLFSLVQRSRVEKKNSCHFNQVNIQSIILVIPSVAIGQMQKNKTKKKDEEENRKVSCPVE